jgi:hypothetical protein
VRDHVRGKVDADDPPVRDALRDDGGGAPVATTYVEDYGISW